MQYSLVFEINAEGSVNPFSYGWVTHRAETIFGFTEFTENGIHTDAAFG